MATAIEAVQADSTGSEAPRFRKRAELSQNELPARDQLVDMCSTLSRAILQNSYYSDDHPQVRQLGEEPFRHWKTLGESHQELTFVVASWSDEEIMALDGVFSEAVGLDLLIGGTAGEHYARKLFAFAKRNKLVSFAIKNTIDEAEFHRFIRVFVKRHIDMEAQHLIDAYDDGVGTGPKFTDQLIDADVVNVSVVLEEDLVSEQRRLPWRVKIALARLRKDLKTIPMYSRATASELQNAKLRLLRDILRPLRRGTYLKQLFLNLDLIQQEVAELQDVALESDLFDALPDSRVRSLTGALLKEHEKVHQADLRRENVRDGLDETLRRQLGLMASRLATSPDDFETIELLRALYEKKAIDVEALPSSLRNDIRTDRWTANFLKNPDSFLSGFDSIESAQAYVSQIPYIVGIVPNLCRVKRYADAAKVVDVLEVHRGTPGPFEGRERLVDAAMRELEGGPTLKMLIAGMVNEPSEVRTILRRLIRIMGKRAVSPLLQVIEETDSEEVKSDCALTLVGVGEVVRQPIEHILLQRSLSDDGARYLLKALIELGHEDSTDVFVAYTRHRTPAVREEALRCVARLHGVAACNVLTRATTDSSPSVAARAIRLLSDQKSKHPGYLYVLLQVLGLAPMSASELRETPVSLQVVAVEALGKLPSQAELGQLGTVESLLLQCLERDEGTMMSLLQRGKVEDKDKVRVAVCDVLGDAGSKLSLERLSQHAREPSPLVRPRMARAASRIQRRLAEASS